MSARLQLLCDTNVWLDHYFAARPGHEDAERFLAIAIETGAELLVPVVSLKDFFYLVQLELKRATRANGLPLEDEDILAIREIAWAALDSLLELATVVGADTSDVWVANRQRTLHDDFEDDLVIAAAMRSKADFLVTADSNLLKHAPVAALSPADMATYLSHLKHQA